MKLTTILLSLSLLTLVIFFLVPVKSVYADIFYQVGTVRGVITGSGGSPVSGANVSALCNGSTITTTSNGVGFYTMDFGNAACDSGNMVYVTASKGGQHGSNNGLMDKNGAAGGVELDLALIDVPLVPEFSLITGVMTFLTSGGAVYFLRKKI